MKRIFLFLLFTVLFISSAAYATEPTNSLNAGNSPMAPKNSFGNSMNFELLLPGMQNTEKTENVIENEPQQSEVQMPPAANTELPVTNLTDSEPGGASNGFTTEVELDTQRLIKIKVGGELLETDVEPAMISSRTMLPVRAVSEAVGADVEYIHDDKRIIITKGDSKVEFVIGSNIMEINGEEKEIDVPALIRSNRTLVPVRACAEALNLKVEWNNDTFTVKIKKPVSLISETPDATYAYDKNGNLLEHKSSNGYWVENKYDENENLVYTENSFGNWKKYSYDKAGNEIASEDSNGRTVKREFDENDREVYYESSEGIWIKTAYDSNGNKISKTDSNEYRINYTYDEHGNVLSFRDSKGFYADYSYDARGNQTYYVTSARYWLRSSYDENGALIRNEDSAGEWIDYVYDDAGNHVQTVEAQGVLMESTYDSSGNILSMQKKNKPREDYTYDESGKLINMTDETGYSIDYTYDEDGNLIYTEDSNGFWEKYIVMEI